MFRDHKKIAADTQARENITSHQFVCMIFKNYINSQPANTYSLATVFRRKLYIIYTASFSVIKSYSDRRQMNSLTIYFLKPRNDNFTKCLWFL